MKNVKGATHSKASAKSTLGGSSAAPSESAGVMSGVSERMALSVDSAAPAVSSDGSHPGFATERLEHRKVDSVSSKGKKFNVHC